MPYSAVFLDRDGVINKNLGYVSDISRFEFFPEIMEICFLAEKKGFPIVVVTNQSGIGRGYFTVEDYNILTKWMIEEFKKNMPEDVYRQEILAEFLSEKADVFRNIRGCATATWQTTPTRGCRYVLAIDWAKKADYTVMMDARGATRCRE